MRVLQICSKPPFPSVDGGCKAMDVITKELLNQKIEIKIVTISTAKHPFQKDRMPQDYLESTAIENTFIDTQVNIFSAIINLFTSKSYNIIRFYNKEFELLIQKNLTESNFDIVLLEGLYVTPYIDVIQQYAKAKIIYRAHNIEHEIWQRNSKEVNNILKRTYLGLLTKKLKKYEKSILNRIDGVAAITQKDKQALLSLGCEKPIEIIPFGINMEEYQVLPVQHKSKLFHIGSMDWLPNQEAIKWFLEHVWTEIVNQFPEEKFYLAGRNMPDWLLNKQQKNLIVVGEVSNAIDFIHENEIMVVPLFSGSGMRIKIIEGMALGKVVIATEIAAEGINYQSNENIVIANNSKEFIDAISLCLTDTSFSDKIGMNAKRMISSNYDNKVIVNNLAQFFKQILQ